MGNVVFTPMQISDAEKVNVYDFVTDAWSVLKLPKTHTNRTMSRTMILKTTIGHLIPGINVSALFFVNTVIEAGMNYPINWMNTDVKSKNPTDIVDNDFFKKHVMDNDSSKWCTPENKDKLLPHQQYVEYVMRPFSPLNALLVDFRTGSGKTRAMIAALENFVDVPNRKLVLLPTEVLRQQFYTEMKTSSDVYMPYMVDNRITHPVRKTSTDNHGRRYEVLDTFTTTFSFVKNPDAVDDTTIYNFQTYFENSSKRRRNIQDVDPPMGSTVVLTFSQFHNMLKQDMEKIKGMRHFVKNGKFTLEGALVLVDEAHLLVYGNDEEGTDNVTGRRVFDNIRKVLEDEKSIAFTGLFTATPFTDLNDISCYRKLLHTDMQTTVDLCKNYLSYFNIMKPPLYNRETYHSVIVPPSPLLMERVKKYPETPSHLKTNIWLMKKDVIRLEKPLNLLLKYIGNLSNYPSEEWYTMSVVKQYEKMVGKVNDHTALLFPKGKMVLDKIFEQRRRRENFISFLNIWKSAKADNFKDNKWHLVFNKDNCSTYILKAIRKFSNQINPDQNQISLMDKIIDKESKRNNQDRSVVMIDPPSGIVEMSMLLTASNIYHVVFGMESNTVSMKNWSPLQLSITDITYFEKKYKDRTLKNTIKNEDIQEFFNEHVDVQVMLFNSFRPEGVNIYNTVESHVITIYDDTNKTLQMGGRTNRMCGGFEFGITLDDKRLFHYHFEDKKYDKYSDIIARRNEWGEHAIDSGMYELDQ